jgi:hypothetical protein
VTVLYPLRENETLPVVDVASSPVTNGAGDAGAIVISVRFQDGTTDAFVYADKPGSARRK